jgi:hypothetical protein
MVRPALQDATLSPAVAGSHCGRIVLSKGRDGSANVSGYQTNDATRATKCPAVRSAMVVRKARRPACQFSRVLTFCRPRAYGERGIYPLLSSLRTTENSGVDDPQGTSGPVRPRQSGSLDQSRRSALGSAFRPRLLRAVSSTAAETRFSAPTT